MKNKKDVLRIAAELMLDRVTDLPDTVKRDMDSFTQSLENEPFDANSLINYGLGNQDVIDTLRRVFV